MASSRQAIKRYRNSLVKFASNRSAKRSIKTSASDILSLVQDKKKDEATKLLSEVYSKIDKAVKRGILHKKTAARKKSRITKALQASK